VVSGEFPEVAALAVAIFDESDEYVVTPSVKPNFSATTATEVTTETPAAKRLPSSFCRAEEDELTKLGEVIPSLFRRSLLIQRLLAMESMEGRWKKDKRLLPTFVTETIAMLEGVRPTTEEANADRKLD